MTETTTKTIDGIRYVKRWVMVYWVPVCNEWIRWGTESWDTQLEADAALDRERKAYPIHEFLLSTVFAQESLPVPEEKP